MKPARPVTPIPNEPGCYLVTSRSSPLPWRVDLFYQEDNGEVLPTCACGIEYHRTDKYRTCHHIKQATDEHNSIIAGLATQISDLRRALIWSKHHQTWPAHWGPRPTSATVQTKQHELFSLLRLGGIPTPGLVSKTP